MRIAFIGLGVMGLPMAENLVTAGHTVVGFNRSAARADLLAEKGGIAATSIRGAVEGADVVISMLPDSPDVELVYRGEGGVFESASSGALLLEMSTISTAVTVRLHEDARSRSLRMLDAPVSGGESGARDGALSIMCGGDQAAFDAARTVLDVLGTTVVLVGGAGSGQTVKAANQLMVAGIIELVAEAMVFLEAHEVDLDKAIAVLNGGLAGNTVLTRKAKNLLDGDFTPGFRVELHHKDLGLYRAAAREKNVFSPLGALLVELMSSLRVTGGAQLDHGALLSQVAALSGMERWAR